MNILVIGNGFDVAHGLPTKYDQFLDFVKCFRKINGISNDDINEIDESYKTYINDLSTDLRKEYYDLINDNVWFEHFIKTKEERKNTKQNWIDFEAEISGVIQELDKIRKGVHVGTIEEQDTVKIKTSKKFILNLYIESNYVNREYYFSRKRVNKIKERLINDLNRLTCCLELYLSNYLNILESCEKKQLFTNIIKPDYVITFNYTDTYELLYMSDNLYCGEKSKKEKIHYIHGNARKTYEIKNKIDHELTEKYRNIQYDFESGKIKQEEKERKENEMSTQIPKKVKIDDCNLVLGIEEYLEGNDRQKDNEYIEFKKFYQRIYKGTGSTYTNWLKQCNAPDKTLINDPEKTLNVTIYGHSIATTDGDIIKNLIEAAATITIYYYDKDALHDIILNLVQIIGEEKLIEMTSDDSKSGRIFFESIT